MNLIELKQEQFQALRSKYMNVYIAGEGEKTIVILSGFGIQSPVLEYKALADRLSENNYRVVVLEYFGYGFSSKTDSERTNENIAREIKQGLEMAGINGPYVLMPHSISNLYASMVLLSVSLKTNISVLYFIYNFILGIAII